MILPENGFINGFISRDREEKKKKGGRKVITFREYLELVGKDPLIAQNAYSRHLENITAAGIEELPEHEQWLDVENRYTLFANSLYGVDSAIAQCVAFIEGGALRASTAKQIPVLIGPPASGKSTFVTILVRALEKYSLRPVYMIQGCPKFEEPLHLIPRHMREQVEKKLNVRIEGDLCPVCRHNLLEKFSEEGDENKEVRWWDVPVEELSFSKQGVRGITSFEPSDEKSSDITALTGRENISVTSMHGYDHPHSYELSGAIPKAERGICEGRELISSDPEVLSAFFSVAEERELKITGSSFPHLSVDTLIIGHTNITPFQQFASNKKFEGLHNRFYIIPFPYPIRIKDELAVYKKLIEQESDFVALEKCHIAPGSLELAALFAILTRLVPSQKNIGILTKAKVYNGDVLLTELEDKETAPRDLSELLEEGRESSDFGKREGMFGVSSRDVLAALNTAIVEQSHKKKCLTPLLAIRSLRDVFDHRMGFSPEDIERYKRLLVAGEDESVMTEYKEWAVETVSKAYLKAYEDLAKELFDKYIKEVAFYREGARKFVPNAAKKLERDAVTGKPREPNEKFLRSIEEHIPWTVEETKAARGELLERRASDPTFSFETYSPLRRAVQKKLISDAKATLSLVLSQDSIKGDEETRRANELFGTLKKQNFCKVCAKEIITEARKCLEE